MPVNVKSRLKQEVRSTARHAKRLVEALTGCRIYRNSLPHGVDCFVDMERWFAPQDVKSVFDIGANEGQSAIQFLQSFPEAEIYSFEPVGATYRKLVAATRHSPRVHAFNLGMGATAGSAAIHVNVESTLSSVKLKLPDTHPESIQLETVSEFAERHQLKRIDFLKVDTEGYDLEVLWGAEPLLRRQDVGFVFAECEPVKRFDRFVPFSELAEFMGSFGYRVFGFYDQSFASGVGNSICFHNALFVCERLANR